MKDDFSIIDLDMTDHIPQVADPITKDKTNTDYDTEDYVDEDYADEEYADEEYAEEEYYAEDSSNQVEEYTTEETIDDEYYESEDGQTEEYYEPEDGQTEEYYESEDGQTEEYYESEDGNSEYYGDEEEDPYYGVNEENAGNEVFQGEVTVDTMIMNGIADAVGGADSVLSEADSKVYSEHASAKLRKDIDEALKEQYTDSVDFEDLDDLEATEDEYYEDEILEKEHSKPRSNSKKKKKKEKVNIFAGIFGFIRNMTLGDWMIAGTGVLILCVAIVTLTFWGKARNISQQVTSMYDVGYGLSNIGIAGESGLLAVADARMNAVDFNEEPDDTAGGSMVNITFTSVEKDMKVKFINAGTGKLVTNVLFEVALTDSNGQTLDLKDEDKDGIIYEKDLTPGTYTVTVTPVTGYTFADFESSVTIKDEIAYEQIDVTQEIKSEAEVNVAVEDTAVNNAEAEAQAEAVPTLADTVEWVESTRTTVDGSTGYQQVDKSTIPEPSYASRNVIDVSNEYLAVSGRLADPMQREVMVIANAQSEVTTDTASETPSTDATVSEQPTPPSTPSTDPTTTPTTPPTTPTTTTPTTHTVTISFPSDLTVKVGSTLQLTPIVKEGSTTINGGQMSYTSKDTATATVDGNGKVTGVKAGTVTITTSYSKTENGVTYSGSKDISVTVTAAGATITEVKLNQTSVPLAVGGTFTIAPTATLSDSSKVTTASSFTFVSDKTTIATVDAAGKVTGVAKGTAIITVTYKDSSNNTKSATCTVTVTDATVSGVTLNKTTTSIAKGNTETLVATASLTNETKVTDASKFTWSSQNTNVATVDATGKITAVGVGTSKITVTYKDAAGNTKSATCTVTVVQNPAQDTTSKLKDKNGNQIYVKNSSGSYVEATFADYYSASEFFLKTDVQYRYTGWQTINGNVYFYDKNGNKVTGEQVIQGVKYNFTADGILAMNNNGVIGIDVSKWNGSIDWTAVKNSGISYVIIRCGYRGSSTGVLVEDPKFKTNIQGATAAGLKVGVYFFTQAMNEVEAVEEASMVLSLIKGYGISYPIFIDTERANGRADGIDRGTRTAVCRAFCETIRNAGYSAGVYASKSWFNDNLNYSSLSGYKIWLAQYASTPTFSNRYDIWQNSDRGTVSGISGKVDMNISYLGY